MLLAWEVEDRVEGHDSVEFTETKLDRPDVSLDELGARNVASRDSELLGLKVDTRDPKLLC